MTAPALVALAHGSRDPRSAETIGALVDEVRATRPDLRIEKAGRGVIVLMRETHRSSPSDVLLSRKASPQPSGSTIRDYGTGAQILRALGIREMILLNTSVHPLVALRGYGLEVVEPQPSPASASGDTG